MILLWGLAADPPLAAVHAALSRMGAATLLLDQQSVLQCSLELMLDDALQGTLRMPDGATDLASVSAVYVRPYDVRQIPALAGRTSGDPAFDRAFSFEDAFAGWTEMTTALVINRPSAMASNNSKPYQLELIRSAGFDVPDTLVTTDPSAALAFWEKHGAVIYKSVSGVRSIVARLSAGHRERLPDVSHCPTQFQQYIPGTDIRIHVVGGTAFGCEILSDADDYRYPSGEGGTQVRSWSVPDELGARCRHLAASLDLPVVGIDLRRTPAGQFFCLEANPSPGFTFYEAATRQPVAQAVAQLLADASV